ncbi:MAG: hypothetical protein JWQ04_2990 [Pedosphaera sp.]|nr:hypothetical protein [Pedosphaera sp.]
MNLAFGRTRTFSLDKSFRQREGQGHGRIRAAPCGWIIRQLLRLMIFGEPADFAIEAYHEPYGPEYGGYGRMCIHMQGTRIGDIRENHCSLFAATARFRELLNNIETLWDESFAGLPDAELFGSLLHALYEDHGQSLEEMKADWKRLGKYVFLTNEGEQFDDFNTIIFCRPGGTVQVLYRNREDAFGSVFCRVESFRNVTESFVRWFDEQVRTIAPPFFPINPFDLNETVPDGWQPEKLA